MIIPGINFMPWDVFFDDSIDCISTPFSVPGGDYEGAAPQQAFYTGYIKAHGIKVETVFLPCIQSYYRVFGAGVQLTDAQKRCNAAM